MNIKFTRASRQMRTASLPPLIEQPHSRPTSQSSSPFNRTAAAAMADGGYYLDADCGEEDKEVKLNLRFCDNSSHDPLIHFDFKQFTPNVSETKSKALTRQQQCSEDTLARLWGSGQRKNNTRTLTSTSMDSIMNAVFTAFDYDIGSSNGASNQSNNQESS